MRGVVERAYLVRPHAGGVHDRAGADFDHLVVNAHARAAHVAGGVFRETDERRVVDYRGAVRGRGLRHRERESRVVGLGVVVDVRRGDVVGRERRHVAECLVLADAFVQLADPESARQVVRPHRRTEESRDPAGEQPVLGEDREQEGEHAHEMRRGLAQDLSFGQRLVDEPDFLLLQVSDAAVYEFRRLGRRARRQVTFLDESNAQSARRGIERDARAGDPPADDEHVERVVGKTTDALRAVERHRIRVVARPVR